MRNRRLGSESPRRLAILFLAVVVPPAVALVWLGLRFLAQDETILAQREIERRQTAAQSSINGLEKSLADAERWLIDPAIPERAVRLTVTARGVTVVPSDRALWVPIARDAQEALSHDFAEAEILEYRGQSRRALERYNELARSSSSRVRAGAFLRVARVHRREGRLDAALAAYRRLAAVDDVSIDGMPADLLARRAMCAVMEEAGRRQDLAQASGTLAAEFLAGRWTLDRSSWELTADQLAAWTGKPLPRLSEKATFSAVAEWFDGEPARLAVPSSAPTRRVVMANDVPVTMIIRSSVSGELTAVAILPGLIETWLKESNASLASRGDRVSLATEDGTTVAGVPPAPGHGIRQTAAASGLPWTLVFVSGDGSVHALETRRRQQLLLAGLAAIVLLLSGGSVVLWRVIQRDLAIARLQTNFVAAVSHEFRTPLASLRHVTELLEEDDNLPVDRRRAFYDMLARNTDRLHRLVESLLDFARMEDGRKPYDLRRVDVADLARRVVEDFRRDARAEGFSIEFEASAAASAHSLADAPSLTYALWNLLDNAVKYSPDRRAIRVSVDRHPTGVAITVRDAGLGIPRTEQRDIFRRFVRGHQADRLGIKGTGLGLAMVDHIVRAHGGAIELESDEGVGSTFRVLLPVVV